MMFISKFNRLLKSKVVWGIFVAVVVVTFVLWGTVTGRGRGGEGPRPAGILAGREISREEFRSVYFDSYLSMSLMFGRPLSIDARTDKALRNMAWGKIAAQELAKKLGLEISAEEVAAEIQKQPFFAENGVFSPQRFNAFARQWLPSVNATVAQFEETVRYELLRDRLLRVFSSLVWVAPAELQQIFSQLYDKFTISYVKLDAAEYKEKVVVTPPDVEKFFEENKAFFTIPAVMRVKYMAFPVMDYMDMEAVGEQDIEDYYYGNTDKFTTRDTNNVPHTAALEDVAEEIRFELAMSRARDAAKEAAAEMELLLAPDRYGKAPSFEEGAASAGLAVLTSAAFTAEECIPGLGLDLKATKAAFELRNTPDEYFSRPLEGKDAVYLLAYESLEDERVPEFAEVREKVVARAKEAAAHEAVEKKAREIAAAVETALAGGTSFEDAVAPFGVEAVTTKPFSVASATAEEQSGDVTRLLRHVLGLGEGEFSGIIPTEDGVVLAFVKKREPADQSMFSSMRMELADFVKRRRSEALLMEWQKSVLSSAQFQNLLDSDKSPGSGDEVEDEPDSGGAQEGGVDDDA